MKSPLWVREISTTFWQAVGNEPYPRSLRGPIIHSGLELTVKEMPCLTAVQVIQYLKTLGSAFVPIELDRALRGCLVARRGAGFIFIDATDPPDERRFTLAHELAHFFRDYLWPRIQAERIFGPTVREVLDGMRPPTTAERVHALLRNVPLGCHVHLMTRGEGNWPPEVEAAERDADLLAFELLAPAVDVLARCERLMNEVKLAALLTNDFGLPSSAACEYAAVLSPAPAAADPLVRRLRESPESCRTSACLPGTFRGVQADGRA